MASADDPASRASRRSSRRTRTSGFSTRSSRHRLPARALRRVQRPLALSGAQNGRPAALPLAQAYVRDRSPRRVRPGARWPSSPSLPYDSPRRSARLSDRVDDPPGPPARSSSRPVRPARDAKVLARASEVLIAHDASTRGGGEGRLGRAARDVDRRPARFLPRRLPAGPQPGPGSRGAGIDASGSSSSTSGICGHTRISLSCWPPSARPTFPTRRSSWPARRLDDATEASREEAAAGDPRVDWLGFVPEDASGPLDAADAAVFARGDGGTSGSLILAISMGTAVVAAERPSYGALIGGEAAGWLFTRGDSTPSASHSRTRGALRPLAWREESRRARPRRAARLDRDRGQNRAFPRAGRSRVSRALVVHVVGARPNFMKVAPLYAALDGEESRAASRPHRPALRRVGQRSSSQAPAARAALQARGSAPGRTARRPRAHSRARAGFERGRARSRRRARRRELDAGAAIAAVKLQIPVATSKPGCGARPGDARGAQPAHDRPPLQLLLTHSDEADANLAAEGIPAERIAFVGNP